MADEHDCLEHLDYREQQFSEVMDVEVDGSRDYWTEVWWECVICHEKYTESEVTRLQNQREVKHGGTETAI